MFIWFYLVQNNGVLSCYLITVRPQYFILPEGNSDDRAMHLRSGCTCRDPKMRLNKFPLSLRCFNLREQIFIYVTSPSSIDGPIAANDIGPAKKRSTRNRKMPIRFNDHIVYK